MQQRLSYSYQLKLSGHHPKYPFPDSGNAQRYEIHMSFQILILEPELMNLQIHINPDCSETSNKDAEEVFG
ncbi:unnamed protein product [Brugia timori]|uniref:Ovule protein n=1 Tax=Brugia timori TaxID=42155 RepID=A0A0R3QGA8_9BILA|nr:unnamed protein product [Brugia timori]